MFPVMQRGCAMSVCVCVCVAECVHQLILYHCFRCSYGKGRRTGYTWRMCASMCVGVGGCFWGGGDDECRLHISSTPSHEVQLARLAMSISLNIVDARLISAGLDM